MEVKLIITPTKTAGIELCVLSQMMPDNANPKGTVAK